MKYRLRLYITGRTINSQTAIDNLRQICETELKGNYRIEVIDVLEHPLLAEDEKILATPTLVKQLPEPVRKIIGDLSDKDKVLLGLDLISSTIN
ncbi:MAG: circadian clock protein KaiB [Armatimonadetes bacterium]|nr:circadian clock protein KaiB [Armatimonadota bacterium]